MNRIKYILNFLAILMLFSCNKNDENPLFNQSTASRLQKTIKDYSNVLTSSKYGWVTPFYKPGNQFGYFNLWFKFNKDGTVRTLSDVPLVNNRYDLSGAFSPKPGYYKDTTTAYSVSYENSVDIVFEEPMVLQYLYSLNNNNSGAAYEFYITKATPDQVTLQSKVHSDSQGQMILKRATSKDKDKIAKSYESWKNETSNARKLEIYITSDLNSVITKVDKTKRVGQSERGEVPIAEISSNQLMVKKDNGQQVVYRRIILENYYAPFLVVPIGKKKYAPIIKFADTGELIPAKTELEGVDMDQVGIYDNAIVKVNDLLEIPTSILVHNPSITGSVNALGSYHDINKPERTGEVSLVKGTNSIFLASDFGFSGIFPVYFQMDGDKISPIRQVLAINHRTYGNVKSVNLSWDNLNRVYGVLIIPAYFHYRFQMD